MADALPGSAAHSTPNVRSFNPAPLVAAVAETSGERVEEVSPYSGEPALALREEPAAKWRRE